MSPSNGLELDFGFSSLLDGTASGNPSAYASSLSDYGSSSNGGGGAADYLSLSNLFDSNSGTGASASNAGAPSAAAWQTKKTLLDQQQQQLQENSLNALLSSNTAASAPAAASTSTSTPNPFGFATREELEALASASASQAQQNSANASSNNYMFVATIVDPNQEDAPPQQMLFLPGSNQVIPMPSSASPMMALANLPVVFPQGTSSTTGTSTTTPSIKDPTANAYTLSLPSSTEVTGTSASANWQQLQQQQQQQQRLSGFSSSGLGNLDDVFSSHTQALAPTPLDFSTLGLASAEQHSQGLTLAPNPAISNSPTNAANNSKAAMPVRPLSAYNFFFSDERERILQNKTDEHDVFDNAKKQRLLLAHLAKDRSKRRPHRKTHGKINFTTLSKLIGQRWKQLPDERKNFYREVAAIDLERYQRELRERSPAGNNNGTDY